MKKMIYDESIKNILELHLSPFIEKDKNFICRCPWCELNEEKTHYHLYISKEIPAFNCFHCNKHGHINLLFKAINIRENVDNLIVKSNSFSNKKSLKNIDNKEFILPEIEDINFPDKVRYIKKRLGSDFDVKNIKNLILDFQKFIEINKIQNFADMCWLDAYQKDYVGFLFDHHSKLLIRSIKNKFYKKIQLFEFNGDDLYSLTTGQNPDTIIVGEGVFDIYSQYSFNFLKINKPVIYVAALSNNYLRAIKYAIEEYQCFLPNIIILSDSNINKNYYSFLKHKIKPIITKLLVYYNGTGKDFNEAPITPVRLF
ncbi:MAG: hypothetical protein KatS3mg002_0438 [Candidatus Woesearchaeota archaeon]|nr:MAG: hypothetical protein KatS3mg002_0438 [Candidatus Woesearchaeota archaeon]